MSKKKISKNVLNPNRIKRRMFISEIGLGDDLKSLFLMCIKKKKQLECVVNKDYPLIRIPRDFDLYLLHLSEINEEDLKNLKEEQDWCKIYATTGAFELPEGLKDKLDGYYYTIEVRNIEDMLESIGLEINDKEI